MPTVRQRHMITETDEVAAALDVAKEQWPQDRDHPAKLLRHLIAAGDAALRRDRERNLARRRKAIAASAGKLTGTYPAGYLKQLRDEWPE